VFPNSVPLAHIADKNENHLVISSSELDAVLQRCADVRRTANEYVATDLVCALLDTVLDFQMHTTAVERASKYFIDNRWDEVRTLVDLQNCLARWPDDKNGNTEIAQYLWGNNHWTRVHMLRGLADYFESQGVSTLEDLQAWAARSDFKRDFQGRVKGLGPAVYHWLIMRSGVESAKPDVHTRHFIEAALGRRASDDEIIEAISLAAKRLGWSTRELDWSIWEHERSE
jgi:hypothetical protein